jgi:hypothetical protein
MENKDNLYTTIYIIATTIGSITVLIIYIVPIPGEFSLFYTKNYIKDLEIRFRCTALFHTVQHFFIITVLGFSA